MKIRAKSVGLLVCSGMLVVMAPMFANWWYLLAEFKMGVIGYPCRMPSGESTGTGLMVGFSATALGLFWFGCGAAGVAMAISQIVNDVTGNEEHKRG